MSTEQALKGLVLQRVISPPAETLEAILQVMFKGYSTEAFATKFPPPPSTLLTMTHEEFDRIHHLCWLGPALIEGQVWVARPEPEGAILGVGIWSNPGYTLGQTPEQRKFGQRYNQLISVENATFEEQNGVIAQRKADLPDLWRDTFHLHNLVTVPEARGRGVGGALIGEMIKQARQEKQGMSLSTPTESNRRFYERHGFKTIWERELVYADGEKSAYIVMTNEAKA